MQIEVQTETIDDLWRKLPNFARDLQSRGFDAVVTLTAGVPATQCYRVAGKTPAFVYVSGSRRLFERWYRSLPISFHPTTERNCRLLAALFVLCNVITLLARTV